jgi:hypothetical protein
MSLCIDEFLVDNGIVCQVKSLAFCEAAHRLTAVSRDKAQEEQKEK